MFAIHRNNSKVVLHDPQAHMVVPLLLDLEQGDMRVALPTVAVLAEDYVAYSSLDDLKRAARDHDRIIDRAVRFSRHYTGLLTRHTGGSPTIRTLRAAIETHYKANRKTVDRAIGNVGDEADLALAGVEPAATA